MASESIRVVLLDVDGTLIDSNDAHAQSWVDVGEEMGYDIEFDAVRRMIGMGGDKVLPKLTGLEEESDEGARWKKQTSECMKRSGGPEFTRFSTRVPKRARSSPPLLPNR